MNKIFFVLCALIMGMSVQQAHAQRSDSIAAVVNNDVITYTNLYDRMNLVMQSSGMPNKNNFKAKILPQVLTGLITEQIQLQKAEELGLEILQQEIDDGFVALATQNNMKPEQFEALLKRSNINIDTLESQIKSQIAWSKVVQREIRPRIALTDEDVASEILRLKQKEGQEEYFVAEIFLPYGESVNAPEAQVRKAASDLSKQIGTNATNFAKAARQFSQSATAAKGGVIGWMTLDQMDEDMALAVRNLPVKRASAPIKSQDGYSILFIRDKRIIELADGGSVAEKLRIKVASFQLPEEVSDRRDVKTDIENFRRDVKGCLDINKQVTKRDNATLIEYYDVVESIPSDIVASVADSDIGDVGTTIETDRIIHVPMLCRREGGGANTALELEVEQRMGLKRMDILQKRYLRDLIAEAYIERRV